MIKVYTPKEWMSLFHGAPSLVIDQGKIYAGNTYHNLVSKDVVGVWNTGPITINLAQRPSERSKRKAQSKKYME